MSITLNYVGFADQAYGVGELSAKAEKALATLSTETGIAVPGLAYLLNNGLAQAIGDTIAGREAKMKAALNEDGSRKFTDVEIREKLIEVQTAKWDAIVSGEVTTRVTGPRLRGVDKFAYEIGELQTRKAFAALKREWPEGKGAAELIRAAIERLWEVKPQLKAAAYTEAEKRFQAEKDLFEMDLGDLVL